MANSFRLRAWHRWWSAALFLAVCSLSLPLQAQDASARAEGRALFDEGMKLFAEQRFAEACPKFEASLRRLPGIGTRGKLAECYEKLGRTASAWALYRETASLAARAGDDTRERVATERAKALEPNLARLTVSLPAGRDVPGLVVKRNGEPLERAVLGAPMPVDPGKTSLEVSAPGRMTRNVELDIAPQASVTFEVPELAPEPAAPAAPAASNAAAPSDSTTVADASPGDERSWQKPTGIAVAGAGVVMLAVGTILGLAARSDYNEPFDNGLCESATQQCNAEGQAQTEDARSKATVATILFGAGLALSAGGAVLYFTAPKGSAAALRLAPAVTTRAAGLTVRGRF